MPQSKQFPGGIHVPSLTFFKNDAQQEIDLEVQARHFKYLVDAGVHGIIIAGSNGEAVALSTTEKQALIAGVQAAWESRSNKTIPRPTITLGLTGQTTHQVIAEARAAKEAGAEFAMVLTPSYYHFAMDSAAIISFFKEVADASPIPVMVYNYPGVTQGLDVNADILIELSRHPNIVGAKLTCGGIGKVPRVTLDADAGFAILSGQIDWMGPAMEVGAKGGITGLANLWPRACVELYNLYKCDNRKAAKELQLKVAACEAACAKGGINGSKWFTAKLLGYPMSSSACRRPFPAFSDAKKQQEVLALAEKLQPLEQELAKSFK